MDEHHAYLPLMLSLARDGADDFDVVHNNSLHHLPIAMAPSGRVPDGHHAAHAAACRCWSRRSRWPARAARFVAVSRA